MNDAFVKWIVRNSPSRHLADYVANEHRKTIKPEICWVRCSIDGIHFRLKVDTSEVHGYILSMYGLLEPELSFFIRRLLVENDFFLDIGANVGYYSVLASKVNPKCQIYAFEPTPVTFAVLQENILSNQPCVIRAEQMALGQRTGVLKFDIYADKALNSVNVDERHPFFEAGPVAVLDVPCAKLDDYLSENDLPIPDVVKLDVEGYEYFVLHGATSMLASIQAPILFCEVEPLWLKRFGLSSDALIDWIEGFGYRSFAITQSGMIPREEIEPGSARGDFVFAKKARIDELKVINEAYCTRRRKAKTQLRKVLRPFWRFLKS